VDQTHASAGVGQAYDPVKAILDIQRSKQRFVPGLLLTLVAAVVAIPAWMFSFAGVNPAYKLRLIAAMVLAALVGLPMRFVGRIVQWRLALVAGVPAGLAIWLGDLITMAVLKTPGSVVPHDRWWECLVAYLGSVWMAAYVARKDLDVSLSAPGAGFDVPAPQVWEDPNAAVMEEPANIFRGMLAVPGTLTLTSRQLRYVEKSRAQVGPTLELANVTMASASLHSKAFTVELRDGTSHRFVVFDRDKWIVHINARLAAARTIPNP
jgi:hypothetical protein